MNIIPNYGKLAEKSVNILGRKLFWRGDTVEVPTVYILSIAATALALLTVVTLVRWWLSNTKSGLLLDDDDPAGLQPRNELMWQIAKNTILPLGYLSWRLGNLKIVGGENIKKAVESKEGTQVVGNHRAIPDTFLPQLAIRFLGFKKLAEDLFRYVVGMIFVNRRSVLSKILEGGHLIPIIPERMLERTFLRTLTREVRKKHLRNAVRINTAAFTELRKFLAQGFWTLIFPEATRVLSKGMIRVNDGVATALRHPGSNIIPMALIGTDNMWRPGSWWPNILSKVTVIFGEPIPYEVVEAQAKSISIVYGVSEDRAFCDIVMRKIALLMIENGHSEYAGFYGKEFHIRLGIN